MGKRKQGDWQKIHQDLQAIYEREEEAASRRQQLLILVVVVLVSISVLGLIQQSHPPTPSSQTLETLPSVLEQEPKQPSVEELALVQSYQADKGTYQFNWDVASFEALTDRYSLEWDDKRQPISLDEVVAQRGKPSLLSHEEGWVYLTYSERFAEHLYEIGQYDQKVTLAFKEENGVWALQYKMMTYMATDELKTLVEGTPFKSRIIEGTNQKTYLRDLVKPLAIGMADNGQGGASLEEALDLLGLPTAYGFWNDSQTFVLVYADLDKIYLWFKRQDNGDYLLAKQD